jgi:hypothetical protein
VAFAVPLLLLGGWAGPCEPEDDGSPSILGPPAMSADDLVNAWNASGRGQPPALTVPIAEVLESYVGIGEAEGVRGDLALAQAIVETGWFTSDNTTRNNFAGIGDHGEDTIGGAFPDAVTGVQAHIQLLKKFAAGNRVALALPDAAPRAKARAETWGQLAGTWASDPNYWDVVARVYHRVWRYSLSSPSSALSSALSSSFSAASAAAIASSSLA